MSPYIRGLGCSGWPYCVNCGGVCSQDLEDDRKPYRRGLVPQAPVRTYDFPHYDAAIAALNAKEKP